MRSTLRFVLGALVVSLTIPMGSLSTPAFAQASEEEQREEVAERDLGAPLALTLLGAGSIVGGILYFVAASDDEALAERFVLTDPRYEAELRDRADTETTLGITLVSVGPPSPRPPSTSG